MKRFVWIAAAAVLAASMALSARENETHVINVNPPPIATDAAVKYDYDIVYVMRSRTSGRRLTAI